MRTCVLAVAAAAAVAVLGGSTGQAAPTAPTFVNFAAPAPLGQDSGEPSIGSNWTTGNVLLPGGLAFDPAVPIYTALQCGGLHGHVKVAPDGTAYVPNADCGGKSAVVASTDNGTTWAVRPVPDSSTQDESDPSLGIGSGGTVY